LEIAVRLKTKAGHIADIWVQNGYIVMRINER